jgi:hypothetical protein
METPAKATEDAPPAEPTAPPAPGPRLTLADRPPAESAPPAVVIAPVAPADNHATDRRRTMRVTGLALVGVGVLSAATSAVLAWQAHSIQEDLATSTVYQKSRENEGRRDATLARWFGAGAAVAAAGGAALLILYRPATAPDPGGAASHAAAGLLGWSGTF